MIKVLIVDDSGFMRLAIKKMLENHSSIEIVGDATTGKEAIRIAANTNPDVITMDVEMPDMDGLEATREIMKVSPTAIIMVSSVTRTAADVTLEALQVGAVDYISKSSSFVSLDIAEIETELIKKIVYWAENYKKPRKKISEKEHKPGIAARDISLNISPDIVLIGASTGGPRIIPKLFSTLDTPQCPIIIALHMPPVYTKSFADHLCKSSGFNVVEGFNGMNIEKDMVVVLPGGVDSHIVRLDDRKYGVKVLKDSEHTIHPSVDELFLSALKATKRLAGVVLSGMGDDGMVGAIEMNKYGLPVIVQEEESCVVYGMPRAIVEAGVASEELNVLDISKNINRWFSSREFNSTAVNGIV